MRFRGCPPSQISIKEAQTQKRAYINNNNNTDFGGGFAGDENSGGCWERWYRLMLR